MKNQTQEKLDSDIDQMFDSLESNIVTVEKAETKGNKKMQKIRTCLDIKIGQTVRQGDIYVTRIDPKKVQKGNLIINRKLAPGNSVGASHAVMEDPQVKLYKSTAPLRTGMIEAMRGPVIMAEKEFSIIHQKHAWDKLPAGCYEVTYQMDFATKQRALD